MKAIETEFDGYKFRSRLEARWAVFLKAINEPYEYEKEGFYLNSDWYLPDFYLPRSDIWLEVKPARFDNAGYVAWPTYEDEYKAKLFAFNHDIILVCGVPDSHDKFSQISYNVFPVCPNQGASDIGHLFVRCPVCLKLEEAYEARAERITCDCDKTGHGKEGRDWGLIKDTDLMKAMKLARRFRFNKSTAEQIMEVF